MGVVWHGRYLEYFEASRCTLMENLGLTYNQIVKLGYHLPVLEAHLSYLKPAFFDDQLEIHPKLLPLDGIKVIFEYRITRGGVLLTTGKTVHAFINHAGHPVRPPKEFLEKIKVK
jgi:acyl-CoA thioester hydrolase